RADALQSFSNLEINTVISRSNMTKKNAALYTALYMGVTEKLMTLDYVIAQYSSISIDKLDIETKNALRLGLYQLMFMDKIPEYSAVSETVNLCPTRSKGYVNAILRSFIRSNGAVEYPKDKWEALSVISSTPTYIIDIFRHSYGDSVAELIVNTSASHKGISLRVNTLKGSTELIKDTLEKRKIEYTVSDLVSDVICVNAPVSELSDLIDGGYVFVQDIASRSAAKLLNAKPGEKILDACACPGGKTFSVAMDMENEGEILACDLHKNKLSLISNGAKKLGIDIISVREQNGKEYKQELDSSFDRVLCDVPCSGLGVISKKPDIKYKKEDSVSNLPSVQYAILSNCARYVRVGGELMYSTCTLNIDVNENVVNRFLTENEGFEPVDFSLGDIHSEKGMYTFFEHITGSDGFFVAKLRRVK
ncbi:MAG: 16S rRNA (cytosine(967)-C(5))-methyltransferase RsmB, partial [Clostridia bacterium]|nr:16S rRNA (cytosine(967)-C(5))-methyltransferase RsmB [Clostridia bacterium]